MVFAARLFAADPSTLEDDQIFEAAERLESDFSLSSREGFLVRTLLAGITALRENVMTRAETLDFWRRIGATLAERSTETRIEALDQMAAELIAISER